MPSKNKTAREKRRDGLCNTPFVDASLGMRRTPVRYNKTLAAAELYRSRWPRNLSIESLSLAEIKALERALNKISTY